MNTLDEVKDILHEINPGGGGSVGDLNDDEYNRLRGELLRCAVLEYYMPLQADVQPGVHPDGKKTGGLVLLYKRVVRRLLRFLLLPLIRQQSEFNAQMIQALDMIRQKK